MSLPCHMMRSEPTLSEMIALQSTVLYHVVLARTTSAVAVSPLEALPTEVVDEILLFAAGTSLRTRLSVQAVCRMFRCLVVLKSTFHIDLASQPLHAAAFAAHFNRARMRNRPFHLILDDSNTYNTRPPISCLLSGAVFARTIVIQHSLPVGEVIATLARHRCCETLTDLTLIPVGQSFHIERLMRPFLGPDKAVSIHAPLLISLNLRQLTLDFPSSHSLRYLTIDGRTIQNGAEPPRPAYQPKTLHALLSRNTHLEVIDLASPIVAAHLDEGPTALIFLPSVTDFKLDVHSVEPMIWLLSCLVMPAEAYISVKVGENAQNPVDLQSFVRGIGEHYTVHFTIPLLIFLYSYSLVPHMRSRSFDTLTVVETFRRVSLLFSRGPREWDGRSGSTIPLHYHGRYLPLTGAVDFELCYTKPFFEAVSCYSYSFCLTGHLQ